MSRYLLMISGLCFLVTGCYYGPTRPILLPAEDGAMGKRSYTGSLELPSPRFRLDSSEYQTVNTAAVGIRLPATRNIAIEIATSGVQLEIMHTRTPYLQFGTVHKIGQGGDGDLFGLNSSRHLIALMNLAQINLKVPLFKGLWLGTGVEYDLRGYTNSTGTTSNNIVEYVTFREYDVFLIQSVMLRQGRWILYGTVTSPPLINKPGYTIQFSDFDTPQSTGVASRIPDQYTWRFGASRDFK